MQYCIGADRLHIFYTCTSSVYCSVSVIFMFCGPARWRSINTCLSTMFKLIGLMTYEQKWLSWWRDRETVRSKRTEAYMLTLCLISVDGVLFCSTILARSFGGCRSSIGSRRTRSRPLVTFHVCFMLTTLFLVKPFASVIFMFCGPARWRSINTCLSTMFLSLLAWWRMNRTDCHDDERERQCLISVDGVLFYSTLWSRITVSCSGTGGRRRLVTFHVCVMLATLFLVKPFCVCAEEFLLNKKLDWLSKW